MMLRSFLYKRTRILDSAAMLKRARSNWAAFLPKKAVVMTREQGQQSLAEAGENQPLERLEGIFIEEGNPNARLMLIGNPPFDGRVGQLLDRMIEAIGLKRSDLYLLQIAEEAPLGLLRQALEEKVTLSQSEVILTFGEFAAKSILDSEEPLSELRGRWFETKLGRVIASWHPAHLLEYPEAKRESWEDLLKIADALGIKIPQKRSRS